MNSSSEVDLTHSITHNYPLVSVIIPYYEGARFITETIQSIINQHSLSAEMVEIIVVNDGSSAESLEALDKFTDQITIIHQENRGQAAARNTGIRHARGSIIGLIDQDDLWPPERLSIMLPYLTQDTYDYVKGTTHTTHLNPSDTWDPEPHPAFLPVLIGAALYRKSVFDVVGMFDEHMRQGDDFDWNVRLQSATTLREKRIDTITLICRRHATNQSKEKDHVKNGQLDSIKKHLQRLRNL